MLVLVLVLVLGSSVLDLPKPAPSDGDEDGPLKRCKITAVKHLDDAFRSIVNNIAEGNGKRSLPDRCRFFDMSRSSALECASCLDILVARQRLQVEQVEVGKKMVVRMVSMLVSDHPHPCAALLE